MPDAPANGSDARTPWTDRTRITSAAWLVAATVAGSLPILWVLGAVPWRLPTLLVEQMFRTFVACASQGGALNPIRMVCPDAGVPLGMYQTDGGLTYPLGGILIRAGIDAVVAWRFSVAVVVITGTGVLSWLLLRLTRSPVVATCFVVVHGLSGTASARSWDWYWRATGAALLPLTFAAAYVLYTRAPHRRLRALLPPGLALLAGVLVISIEWQYAGLFAAGTATAAVLLLILQDGWRWQQRAALAASTAAGLGAIAAFLRWRLAIAGITAQMDNALVKATEGSVDLVSFVVPDGPMSLTGRLLTALGQDDRLVRSMVEHKQLWVAPYIGVLVVLFFVAVLALRRLRVPPDPGRPRGFLVLLSLVAVASVVLALGPVIRMAGLIHPSAAVGSPVRLLYAGTLVEWIRFPRTWGYLLHLSLLLLYAALATALLRDRARRWSPLVVVLVVLLVADVVSPQVLNAANDPRPSVALAPEWNRIDSDDPAAVRFAARERPVFEEALRSVDGPVVMLPWRNAWNVVSMGPDVGIPVRNVGIDRNLVQVVAASPFAPTELERPRTGTMRRMLDSGWASAVVLLDHTPHGTSISRYDSGRFTAGDLARQAWRRRHEQRLARDGYCVDSHTWFAVIAHCDDPTAVRAPAERAGWPGPSGAVP